MKNPRLRSIGLVGALVLVVVVLAQCVHPVPVEYTAPISPLVTPVSHTPVNVTELLSHAALVVIGEVGPVDKYIDFAIYGEDGQLVEDRPLWPSGDPVGDISATDFVLYVEEVLRDDGTIAAGAPVILRSSGYLTEEGTRKLRSGDTNGDEYAFPWTGDRGLYLLHPTPDGEAYSFYYYGYGWLQLDGEQLSLSHGVQSPLVLDGEEVSLSALRGSLQHPDAAFVADFSRYATLESLVRMINDPVVDAPYYPPAPTVPAPTPEPTIDLVQYHMGMWGVSRRVAEERLAWLAEGGDAIVAEADALVERLKREEPTYITAWREPGPDFRLIVRLEQVDPDEATFTEKYLQEYAWADRVTLLGRNQDDPLQPPFTPSPIFTPTPVVDPVDFYQERYGFTREGAIAKAKWAAILSGSWRDEASALHYRLQAEHPTYLVSWVDDYYFFTFYIRFDEEEPDAEAFAEQYLQGYEWTDRVTVLGKDE